MGHAPKLFQFENWNLIEKYKQCHKVEITMRYLSREFVFIFVVIFTTCFNVLMFFFSKRGVASTQSTLNPSLGNKLSSVLVNNYPLSLEFV